MNDITQTLVRLESGDYSAAEQLLPLVYEELRKLATSKLSKEKPGQTLQATALVHEAFIRLQGTNKAALTWSGRGHFFAAAAEAMRRILVEQARRKQRVKHGGARQRTEFDEVEMEAAESSLDLLELDAALDKLKVTDSTAAELVHLRYFTGLTLKEAAELMDISSRTADRVWAYARAWLHREIRGE